MKYPSRGRGRGTANQNEYQNSPSINCRNPARQADLQQLAADIHLLGERALYELFRELDQGADLHATFERYARLAPLAEHIMRQPPERPPIRLSIAGVSLS